MAQIWIEVEENPNCGYLPLRTYSSIGEERSATSVLVAYSSDEGRTEVTGWSSEGGGSQCAVRWVRVGDSGEGESILVYGDDWGVRLRPEGSPSNWDLAAPDQSGEPYLLISPSADIQPSSGAGDRGDTASR